MLWVIVMLAAGVMLALAVLIAYVLGWANRVFHVPVDPRVEAVTGALPGANCGGCGFVGCADYAAAVVEGRATPDKCPVGGSACAERIASILGIELKQTWPFRPVVHCGAHTDERLKRGDYRGEPSCAAANIVGGVQGCTFGCLGLGDCERACLFDAIHVVDGLATVDYHKCTGCGACARVCPRNIITMVPFKSQRMIVVACSNQDFGKDVRAVCKVGCIGCKACERLSGLFKVQDNLPRIDYDKYDPTDLGPVNVVLTKCPMRRITEVGIPTPADQAAVADQEPPAIVTVDFKTTVDKTEWHG